MVRRLVCVKASAQCFLAVYGTTGIQLPLFQEMSSSRRAASGGVGLSWEQPAVVGVAPESLASIEKLTNITSSLASQLERVNCALEGCV